MYDRKGMTAVLAACLLAALTACGGNKTSADTAPAGQDTAAETAVETTAAAAEETAAAESAAETTAAEAATEETTAAAETAGEEAQADTMFVCPLVEHPLSAEADGIVLEEGGYMTISLSEEAAAAYPDLQGSLEGYDLKMISSSEEAFEEIRGTAEAFRKDYNGKPEEFPAGRMMSSLEVARFDEKVLSFCETIDAYYPGAAHGMVGYDSMNYDVKTGNELACTDVIADMAGAEAYVAEHLTAADGTAIEVDREILDDYFAENGELSDFLVWIVDEEGVTFRFGPSAITAYAVGTLEAKIPFAECPELFAPEWR